MSNKIDFTETKVESFLIDKIIKNNLTPNPMHTLSEQEIKVRLEIHSLQKQYEKDLSTGAMAFLDNAYPEEEKQLKKIFLDAKLDSNKVSKSDQTAEARFLETIAKRTLSSGDIKLATCMFYLIVCLFPDLGSGWVGWAVAEQELKNFEKAKTIFSLGITLLKNNFFLTLYAAKFFLLMKDKGKAKEILTELSLSLKEEPLLLDEVHKLLAICK